MRTTLDLSPRVHADLTDSAKKHGKTLSAEADRLLLKALLYENLPEDMTIDPVTGLAQVDLGRPVTTEEIQDFIAQAEMDDLKLWLMEEPK